MNERPAFYTKPIIKTLVPKSKLNIVIRGVKDGAERLAGKKRSHDVFQVDSEDEQGEALIFSLFLG